MSTHLHLQVYLHELEQTAGTASIPPAALRVLNSKACRYAVMFGALQCTARVWGMQDKSYSNVIASTGEMLTLAVLCGIR